MRRSFIYTIATVLTVLILLAAIPFFIPWSKYKETAIEKLYETTGYVLVVKGDISGGLMPLPHIKLEQVSIANAKGAEPFAAADVLEASVALAPLFKGQIELGGIALEKPVIRVAKRADGTGTWEVQKPTVQAPQPDLIATPETQQKKASVSIGTIALKNGDITYVDEAAQKTTHVLIGDLNAKVPSLEGPFALKGDLVLNDLPLYVDATVGNIKDPLFDVDGVVELAEKALQLKVKGKAGVQPTMAANLAFEAALNDVARLAAAKISLPVALQGAQLKGHVVLDENTVTLKETTLKSPLATGALEATVQGLKAEDKIATLTLTLSEALDVDALLKALPKTQQNKTQNAVQPAAGGAATAASTQANSYALLPMQLSLPAGLSGTAKITAPKIIYKGKATGAVTANAALSKGGVVNITTNIADLPGGGSFSAAGGLKPNSVSRNGNNIVLNAPVLAMDYAAKVNAVKTVVVEWLELAKDDVFENPNMPKTLDAKGKINIAGNTAGLSFDSIRFGQTNASGRVGYQNSARPLLGVYAVADSFLLQNAGGAAAASAPSKTDLALGTAKTALKPPSLPALPFDLKFDVSMGAFKTASLQANNVKAVGSISGQSIVLSTLNAVVNGGAIALSGNVADVSQLAGVDVKAALNTSDIRNFVSAIAPATKLPEQVKGAVQANVALKGSRSNMGVDANIANRGLRVLVGGTLSDVLNPVLPGALTLRVQHASFVEAVRLFSPTYTGKPAGGLDLSTTLQLGNKRYTLSDLAAKLGSSDLAGKLVIDMSGSVPAVSGNLSSNVLALGDLVGVKAKTKTAYNYSPQGVSPLLQHVQLASGAGGGGAWSNTALPTSMLRAFNLDLTMAARLLSYGTWRFENVSFPLSLSGGALSVAPFKGSLYGGALNLDIAANAAQAGGPLSVKLKGGANGLDLGAFMAALTSQNSRKLNGNGNIDVAINGSGASAAALVNSLNGSLNVETKNMSILGIDLEKLGQGVDAVLDGGSSGGGWQGALLSSLSNGFSAGSFGLEGGSTGFKDMQHTFPITGGVLNVADLKLDTRSGLVRTTTNGEVSFPAFKLNLVSNIYAVRASKSVLDIVFKGPLNAPERVIDSSALKALVGSRVQKQVDKLVGSDKVQNVLKKAPGLGQLLGLEQPAPAQQTAPDPAPAPSTGEPANTQPAPAEQPQQPAPQKPVEQQLIEGLFNQLGR